MWQDVDIDLYGRAFDGIFGPGAEQIARRETLLRLKRLRDHNFNLDPSHNYVNRDLYGRGDTRIFGAGAIGTAHIPTQIPSSKIKKKRNKSHVEALRIPAGFMGKLAKLCEQRDQEKRQQGVLIPLESISSKSSSTDDPLLSSSNNFLSPLNPIDVATFKSHSSPPSIVSINQVRSSSSKGLAPGQFHADENESEFIHSPANIDNVPRRIRSRRHDEMDRVSSVDRGRVMRLIGSLEEHGPFSPRHSIRSSAAGSVINVPHQQRQDHAILVSPDQLRGGHIQTTPVTPGISDSSDSSSPSATHTSSRSSSAAPLSTTASSASSNESSFQQNHPSQRPSQNVSSSTTPVPSSSDSSHIPIGPGEDSSDARFASTSTS